MDRNANLYTLLRSGFPTDPNTVCLELEDGSTISYGKIDADSGQMAALLHELGVTPGERVLAQTEKSVDAVVLYLACLRAGAVYLPLNMAYTPHEVHYFLHDAEPRLVVCSPEAENSITPLLEQFEETHLLTLGKDGKGSLLERFAETPDSDLLIPVCSDDLAAILYTSGTTGRSKGAMLSHENLAANLQVLHRLWGFRQGDVLIHALPIFHVHGLFVALHCALFNGSRILFLGKFDAEAVLERLPRASVLMGVPTFYVRLLEQDALDHRLSTSMRLFVSGSAPLRPETFNAFRERTGHTLLERYGMTEAGMITSNPLHGERMPGSVGYLLPGVRGRVCNEQGDELPRGKPGVLEIAGPNVFRGYWRMPEKTAEAFRSDGYFITGDIATMMEDGRITIVGRTNDLIISGGYNIYPKEIELVIDALPGVLESAVVGAPHTDFGEAVVAVVVADGRHRLDKATILRALADQLARFKHPKAIFFVDDLPRNAMGKVEKARLREDYKAVFRL